MPFSADRLIINQGELCCAVRLEQCPGGADLDSTDSNASIAGMATLTIRNLPDEVRDQLRRAASERGRSMEEEARQALAQRYCKQVSVEEVIRRLSQIAPEPRKVDRTGMAASELIIADRRLESLVESGLISRKEKADWDRRIDDDKVSLAEVEQFVTKKHNWQAKKS